MALLDLVQLAKQRGWRAEDPLALAIADRRLRQGHSIVIIQEVGATEWQKHLPETVKCYAELPSCFGQAMTYVVITDRKIRGCQDVERLAILRPPTLALGIACRREAVQDDLEEAWRELCRRESLSPLSLMAIGASTCRQTHAALVDFAEQQKVPLLLYPGETFQRTPWPPRGTVAGTCQVSALLAAGTNQPLVPSRAFFGKLSMSVARRK